MDSSSLVSIIIPVYNTGSTLYYCLESCIHQTYPNLEIIVVNDGSTDQTTLDILNKYAAQDSRIVLINLPQNQGQSNARNVAIEACHGAYFTMVDSDDRFVINYVTRCMEVMQAHDVDFILSTLHNYVEGESDSFLEDMVKNKSQQLSFQPHHIFMLDDLVQNGKIGAIPVNPCCKFFNTERYRAANLKFNTTYRVAEDDIWYANLVVSLKSMYYLPMVCILRSIHYGSLTISKEQNAHLNQIYTDVSFDVFHIFKSHGVGDLYIADFAKKVLNHIIDTIDFIDTVEQKQQFLIKYLGRLQQETNTDLRRLPSTFNPTYNYWQAFNSCFYDEDASFKLMWFALPCLFDRADQRMTAMLHCLEALPEIGWSVEACFTQMVSDKNSPQHVQQIIQSLFQADQKNIKTTFVQKTPVIDFPYTFFNCKLLGISKDIGALSDSEHAVLEQFAVQLAQQALDQQISTLLVTGSDPCSLKLFALFKQKGLRLIYVATGYEEGLKAGAPLPAALQSNLQVLQGKFTLPQNHQEVLALFDHVVTYSASIAEEWRKNLQVPIANLGYLARFNYLPELKKEHEYIAVTSTRPQDGFAIALKLMSVFKQQQAGVKFFICFDSEQSLRQTMMQMHFPDGSLFVHQELDLSSLSFVTKPLNLDLLYDQSFVLLHPSLENSTLAEPMVNALTNGVPVITSDMVEQVALKPQSQQSVGSVSYLPLPASTQADPYCLPTDEEIAPYVEAIKKLMEQDAATSRHNALTAYDMQQSQLAWKKLLSSLS